MHDDIAHPLRLLPGEDLKKSIQQYVTEHNVTAGWLVTCAGSLSEYHIRFANANEGSKGSGHFEIVSLSGTVSTHGSHLHICIANDSGKTIGGHLLEGCIIYTTAEIVLTESGKYNFTREEDAVTGCKELKIDLK